MSENESTGQLQAPRLHAQPPLREGIRGFDRVEHRQDLAGLELVLEVRAQHRLRIALEPVEQQPVRDDRVVALRQDAAAPARRARAAPRWLAARSSRSG